MKLKIKSLSLKTAPLVSMIHEDTAKELSLHVGNRIKISKGRKNVISIIDTIDGVVNRKQIATSDDIVKQLRLKNNDVVDVTLVKRPTSIELIKKKLSGERLSREEIKEIVTDIANNALTEVEIAFFVSAVFAKGMTLTETKDLTRAMVKTGKVLKLRGKIADKHSIGGVAGNRTTPITVSICAAAGLIMPKTSSRAITSAAGTADVIETIANVEFSISQIKKIVKKTNACFVWGGALGLAPVDDTIIKIERVVNIDSTAQLLASILSKKISVDSKYILIDIPNGKSAKVSRVKAKKLGHAFESLARKFDLKVKVVLTNGSEPIGNGIGPVLEIKDVIKVLTGEADAPKDLEDKSVFLAGQLLELTNKAKKGKGEELAREILDSGKAYQKFVEIVKAQNEPGKKFRRFVQPKFSRVINARNNKRVKHIDNQLINRLARYAGCPEDKLAGLYLHKKKDQFIVKREPLLTIYAQSKEKLKYALKFYKKNRKQIIEFY